MPPTSRALMSLSSSSYELSCTTPWATWTLWSITEEIIPDCGIAPVDAEYGAPVAPLGDEDAFDRHRMGFEDTRAPASATTSTGTCILAAGIRIKASIDDNGSHCDDDEGEIAVNVDRPLSENGEPSTFSIFGDALSMEGRNSDQTSACCSLSAFSSATGASTVSLLASEELASRTSCGLSFPWSMSDLTRW